MKTLFIGSSNKHKIDEIKDILHKNSIYVDIKCPKDFNDESDPIEDGLTFSDNAKIKANFYYHKYHLATIGEDSGICIDYFNGLPGIHSKRFLSDLNDHDKNEYILKMMKDINNRKARFITSLCYIDENGSYQIFEGINEGEISFCQKGDKGFGYDPIFLIPEYNKTEAELGEEYKNVYSHRAKAFKEFVEYIKNYEKD